MPYAGYSLGNQDTLDRAMASMEDLASGRFAERMRRDAAARMLVTVKRVQRLRACGLLADAVPRAPQRRAVGEVERIAEAWLPGAMTAAEFIGDLPPADMKLFMELAPSWAIALSTAARR